MDQDAHRMGCYLHGGDGTPCGDCMDAAKAAVVAEVVAYIRNLACIDLDREPTMEELAKWIALGAYKR